MRLPTSILLSALLSASLLLAGCAGKPLAVRAAQPEPAPRIKAPEVLKEPVERPSWMPPAQAMVIALVKALKGSSSSPPKT